MRSRHRPSPPAALEPSPPGRLSLEARVDRALAGLWRPRPGPQLPALCRDLDLVVDLQRCAQREPQRMASLCERHEPTLALWLFGVALGCAGLGLYDEALGMLGAVAGVDAGGDGRETLLTDIIDWQRNRTHDADGNLEESPCTAA